MEVLPKAIVLPRLGSIVQALGKHIAVAFMPRRVVHFGNNSLYVPVGWVKAVEETHGIEAMPEVSQVGQHADRPARIESCILADQAANRTVDGVAGIAKMVPAPQIGKVPAVNRPKPASLENSAQLSQIEIHHKESILKDILDRPEPSVTHLSLIDSAVHI